MLQSVTETTSILFLLKVIEHIFLSLACVIVSGFRGQHTARRRRPKLT